MCACVCVCVCVSHTDDLRQEGQFRREYDGHVWIQARDGAWWEVGGSCTHTHTHTHTRVDTVCETERGGR